MPAPSTINACGWYAAERAGASIGEARLHMKSASRGTLVMEGASWNVTGNAESKRFRATHAGAVVTLKIKNRNRLEGDVDGDTLVLTRNVLRPISAAEMAEHDPGPSAAMQAVLDATPDYAAVLDHPEYFWRHFGPLHYRGRLDGSARIMAIASDPGPTECLPFVRRSLVGDSGQKVQGFLAKLGLVRSYVLVNAFAVALHPSKAAKGPAILRDNVPIRQAREAFYDALLAGGALEAIVAFGGNGETAHKLWKESNPAVAAVPFVKVAHPAFVDSPQDVGRKGLAGWKRAITKLRALVAPDAGGDPSGPNYGAYLCELDYERVPRRDLPAAAPAYVGDDSWGRAANPRHNNCCERPKPDDGKSLLLDPPPGQGDFLKYRYENGALVGAKKRNGQAVAVDAMGIPI